MPLGGSKASSFDQVNAASLKPILCSEDPSKLGMSSKSTRSLEKASSSSVFWRNAPKRSRDTLPVEASQNYEHDTL